MGDLWCPLFFLPKDDIFEKVHITIVARKQNTKTDQFSMFFAQYASILQFVYDFFCWTILVLYGVPENPTVHISWMKLPVFIFSLVKPTWKHVLSFNSGSHNNQLMKQLFQEWKSVIWSLL